MINPKILNNSTEILISEEACISLPDVYGNVKRSKSVVLEYTNLK
jgi:peptide deformylase